MASAQGKPPTFAIEYPFVIVLYYFPAFNQAFAMETTGAKPINITTQENDIVDYVLREFECDGCKKEKRQPTRLPAATPRTYDFNVVIGVDLLFVRGSPPRDEHPILNITDLGTLYSTFTVVDAARKSSALVWSAFLQNWVRVFGAPSFI